MDARLAGLARRYGCVDTRYADDLTFSFKEEPAALGRFFWWVDQICQQEGFAENVKKRRVLRQSSQQRVTGVVVNDGLRIPRDERRKLRAMLHECRKKGLAAAARGREGFGDYLLGLASEGLRDVAGVRWARKAEPDGELRRRDPALAYREREAELPP